MEQLALDIGEAEANPINRNLIRDLTSNPGIAIRVYEIILSEADLDTYVRTAWSLFSDLRDYGGGYTILTSLKAHGVMHVKILAWVDEGREGMFPDPNVGANAPTAL